MNALPACEAYRRWAPNYDAETAVSALEDLTVATLGVDTSGRRLLDVGCGTGRRLRGTDAGFAVGIDLTREMVAQAPGNAMVGDARALPVASESFDVVWCRLVVGHLPTIEPLFAELARVCRVDGYVIVTDLSTEAATAGHRRTFRDADGVTHEVEHHIHTDDEQIDAARTVGLALDARQTGVVGPPIRSFYADAGRLELYEGQAGLPIVLALAFRKVV